MLISSEIYLLESKGIKNVERKSDGKQFALNTLYLKTNEGIVKEVVVNDFIFGKAETGKTYKIKALLGDNGKISINDIELCK